MIAVNVRRRTPEPLVTRDGGSSEDNGGRGGMYGTVRLAGVSAILAAAFVLATEDRGFAPPSELRPSLVVVFESQGEMNGTSALSRPETDRDIVLK
jgi:hypothetical protein